MNVVPMRRPPNEQTQDQREAECVALSAELHDAALRGAAGASDMIKLAARIVETAERLET